MTVPAAIALATGETPVKDIEHPSTGSGYRRLRTQVEADATTLRASLDGGTGAAVRHAYRTLDRTLGQAVAFVERLVPPAHRTHHPPAPVRSDKRQARLWHLELRRLRDARERLRFLALDEPRVRTPDTMRVATRAATGPPVPGLRVGEHAAPQPPGNGMGVDLAEALDRVPCRSSATPRAVVGRSQAMSGGPSRRTLTPTRSAPGGARSRARAA